MKNINDIINKKYNTTLGINYFHELLKNKYPTMKINENNVETLKVEEITQKEFLQHGYTGIYYAKDNTIKILTELDENLLSQLDESEFNEDTIINTFLHEYIHMCTSNVALDNTVYEGINIRTSQGQNSFFVVLNEGITQMITDDLMGIKSDAYVFETNIAKQLSLILGQDNLISIYCSGNPQNILDGINNLNSGVDALELIQKIYIMHSMCQGAKIEGAENIGTEIQKSLITLYQHSNQNNDEEFYKLTINQNNINGMVSKLPIRINSMRDIGFENIGSIELPNKGDEYNGKK